MLLPRRARAGLTTPSRLARRLAFAMKFQQYTGPVMAKGVEDTAFYRYNRLVSLNEVGRRAARFGALGRRVPRANAQRRRALAARACSATATHDTKRSEDVRARINVALRAARRVAARPWAAGGGSNAAGADRGRRQPGAGPQRRVPVLPDAGRRLAGGVPATALRARALVEPRSPEYMQKAIKEAKVHTSWINPDEAYETAVRRVRRARR